MDEEIIYSQLILPSTMRSKYWKYFGFPADHTGILSRKKIICTICHTSIAYNKNTTNLKAHLQARHCNSLLTLEQTPSKKIKLIYSADLDGLKTHMKSEECSASPKYLYLENTTDLDDELSEMEQRLIEPDGKSTSSRKNDIKNEFQVSPNSESFQATHTVEEAMVTGNDSKNMIVLIDNDKPISSEPGYVMTTHTDDEKDQIEELIYRSDSVDSCMSTVYDADEALLQLIVESGMPAKVVEGRAFKRFCSTLNANFQVPTAALIEQGICTHFHSVRSTAHSELIWNLRNNSYYSVGFDMWTNFNKKSFITISIFHTVEGEQPSGAIRCENIQTLDASMPNEWSTIFCEFNLLACTASILNFDIKKVESLEEFLNINEIPILYCYGYVISRAVERCFSLPIVKECFKNAIDLLQRNVDDEEHPQPPVVHDSFWLTKHQLLEYFIGYFDRQSFLNDFEVAALIAKIKSVVKCIETLKFALDTISRDKISLVWPVTEKIMEKHFNSVESNSFENEIKMEMQNELRTCLTPESFYLIVSFLDPRCQNLTKPETFANTKAEIRRMCMVNTNNDSDMMAKLITPIKSVQRDVKSTNLSIDLSYFFGDNDGVVMRKPQRCRLDIEIDNYLTDVDETLGICPFEWWQSRDGSFYPNLRQLVRRYQCVPPTTSVNQLPLDEQLFQHNRRFMLNGKISYISKMCWLASRNLTSN